jgi:hypothetical protein
LPDPEPEETVTNNEGTVVPIYDVTLQKRLDDPLGSGCRAQFVVLDEVGGEDLDAQGSAGQAGQVTDREDQLIADGLVRFEKSSAVAEGSFADYATISEEVGHVTHLALRNMRNAASEVKNILWAVKSPGKARSFDPLSSRRTANGWIVDCRQASSTQALSGSCLLPCLE